MFSAAARKRDKSITSKFTLSTVWIFRQGGGPGMGSTNILRRGIRAFLCSGDKIQDLPSTDSVAFSSRVDT
ncbi:hypothetical protein SERLA73DRAFT_171243 [Serpula lacrymans var. lacrymans S7.3]|uniref:Uncharacterized protein n=1 Tax=Serpula lacrymans var. lacrymans (strain S7.3) TaxID=936435 RepID=F8Q9V4_SERL3|nr:hypothetical protein SERLA73DRAFT_171243 [Serpula lacrymans var. lacrymans S7.3]